MIGSYSPLPIVFMIEPGFMWRAFLIQRASVGPSLRYRPPAMVWREATCVRSGPMLLTAPGTPWIAWQPMQPPSMKPCCAPRTGSPPASRASSYSSPFGKGVCGTAVATGEDQNVGDVRARENYIACNLFTKSELVVLIKPTIVDDASSMTGELQETMRSIERLDPQRGR